jgi:hypothetical protein
MHQLNLHVNGHAPHHLHMGEKPPVNGAFPLFKDPDVMVWESPDHENRRKVRLRRV